MPQPSGNTPSPADLSNRPRVRVNSDVAGEQFDKPGTRSARQAHADSRLQDAVAFGNHALYWIQLRPVQRVSHRSCQMAGGFARKLRVGVEGDNKLHAQQNSSVADDLGKTVPGPAAQQGIELS